MKTIKLHRCGENGKDQSGKAFWAKELWSFLGGGDLYSGLHHEPAMRLAGPFAGSLRGVVRVLPFRGLRKPPGFCAGGGS